MFKTRVLSKKMEFLLNLIFICSVPFLTLILLRDCQINVLILSLILSLIIGIVLKLFVFKNLFKNINIGYFIVSIFIGIYISKIFCSLHTGFYLDNLTYNFDNLPIAFNGKLFTLSMAAFSIPAIVTFVYLFIDNFWGCIKNFYLNLSKFEKKYLIIISALAFFITLILYYFIHGFYSSDKALFDIFYTSDSSAIFKGDAFVNLNTAQNDLRQPLFGLFALPFAVIAKLLSEILFFVPNGYAVFLTTIQIILLNVSAIMLTKLLKFDEEKQKNYLLLYFFSFTTIIFGFIMEQYLIGLFYLILTIYIYFTSDRKINYAYLGAVSTLLTSGILFPFISKFKNLKYWLINIVKCFLAFVALVIVFGQLPQVVEIFEKLQSLLGFAGDKLSFPEKLMQYLSFVGNIFIAPASNVFSVLGHPSYQLAEVKNYNILGIIILLVCFVSVLLNRKNKLALTSGAWILFSFILLCVVGWGTAENGLILYSLYFSWAFVILLYLFIDKVIRRSFVKRCLVITLCCLMLIFNIPEFINIINFGLEYYGR